MLNAVLDEATSQIDVASEELIHEALSCYVKNRTVIADHRDQALLRLADSILEVDHGQVTKNLPQTISSDGAGVTTITCLVLNHIVMVPAGSSTGN